MQELDTVLIVENLPVVPEAKHGKLVDFVMKIYSNLGEVAPGGIHMPVNSETKLTEGSVPRLAFPVAHGELRHPVPPRPCRPAALHLSSLPRWRMLKRR